MNAIIRQIEHKDIAGFHQTLESVASEGKYLLTIPPVPFENIEKFVLNNIKNKYAQYIAEVDGEIIGWADINPHVLKTKDHIGSLGMGVLSQFRGKGIGSQLLEKTIDHAWKQGLTRLELEVFSDNENAIALYKRFGYEIEGTRKYARLYNGKYQHCVIMAQYRV